MQTKVVHILYSGLSGLFDVVKNIVEGDKDQKMKHYLVFYGRAKLVEFYKEWATQNFLEFKFFEKKQLLDFKVHLKILEYVNLLKAQTVLFHSHHPIFIFKFFGKQKNLILVEHTQINFKTKADFIRSAFGFLFANKIVALSNSQKNDLKNALKIFYNEKKVNVISNGVEILENAKMKTYNTNEVFHFGMISRIEKQKDILTILKACNVLKSQEFKFHFHLAGSGSELNNLKTFATENEINKFVTFYGLASKEKIKEIYKQLHLYIQSTTGESFSVSIAEAGANKVPVAATFVNDLNLIYKEDEICFFNLGDEMQLAKKIMLLANDVKLRENFSNKLYQKVANAFSNEEMARKYFSLVAS